jgi:exopolysaccharide biosynthesis WecB/TagA/CpsF family protein
MGAVPSRDHGEAAHGDDVLHPALELARLPPASADNIAWLGSRRRMRVLNTWVDVMSGQEVLGTVASGSYGRPQHLCYVNAHSLNLAFRDERYRAALECVDLAARMRGRRFPENLNGSDFTLRLLGLAADRGWRVYLYGGRPGVASTVQERLSHTIEHLQVVGVCDGYGSRSAEEIVEEIRTARADVLIVALGQPQQELWLDAHLDDTGCRLGVGVGAFLDFVAGRVARAPRWMNRLGIEWLFRLAHEPGRLWRRYIVGNPLFLWRAWRFRAEG